MDTLRIIGGRELRGRIVTPGAKNSCLKLLAMSIMASGECVISNVPRVTDVDTMCQLLEALGANVSHTGPGGSELIPRRSRLQIRQTRWLERCVHLFRC